MQKTKKRHIDIWNHVAKQLVQKLGLTVSGQQVRDKFNHPKKEYMKRLKSIERSGASPTALYDWIFYPHLEPYFRSNKQVSPDYEECSEGTPRVFKFPSKRKLSNKESEETSKEKRFRLVHEALEKTNEIISEHFSLKNELLRLQIEREKRALTTYPPYQITQGYSVSPRYSQGHSPNHDNPSTSDTIRSS